jgi:glutathione S-transferase
MAVSGKVVEKAVPWQPMQYLSVPDARKVSGLRLVLSTQIPGPYGEAAKAILRLRGLSYIPVEQVLLAENKELRDWTGVRNAPVAVLEGEAPMTTWLDILMMAERRGSGPSLLPSDPLDRAMVLGLSTDILSRDGFSWCLRLVMNSPCLQVNNPHPTSMNKDIREAYGIQAEGADWAPEKIRSILTGLSRQLSRQLEKGSEYLVGDRLSAVDIYWACFSNPIAPLAHEDCPMPDWLRNRYKGLQAELKPVLDDMSPALLRHRDMIFSRYIGLPLVF